MLKCIGFFFIFVGVAVAIYAFFLYRKNDIGYVKKELILIQGQGYADKHEKEELKRRIYQDYEAAKVPRKKRTMNENAKRILAEIEGNPQGINTPQAQEAPLKTEISASDLVAESVKKAKEETPAKRSAGTDILDEKSTQKGTDILTDTQKSEGTDVLHEPKGTDVLAGDKGTDILENAPTQKGTEVLSEPKGTDVLTEVRGTDVLEAPNGTEILKSSPQGTDVLSGGTEVLD